MAQCRIFNRSGGDTEWNFPFLRNFSGGWKSGKNVGQTFLSAIRTEFSPLAIVQTGMSAPPRGAEQLRFYLP